MMRAILMLSGCYLAFVPFAIEAQSTGEVTGIVSDPSKALIPNVELRLTNTGTGSSVSTRTNADGIFHFTNVLPGSYEMTASAGGFAPYKLTGIAVDVSRTTRADVALQLLSSQQQVTVAAGEQLLDFDTGAKGQVIGSGQVESLPLETRNPLALMTLAPGVVAGNGGTTSNRQGSDGTAITSVYIVNGGIRTNYGGFNEFVVDGISITNRRDGTVQALPSTGSIEQFQVQSGGLSAEFGDTVGGVINYVTKSGTNLFHGLLFEDYRGTDSNARRALPAISTKPPYVWNQFGGNVGGPVLLPRIYNGRNKTFFFVDYDGSRWVRNIPMTVTVPTALMHSGNFSELTAPIYDPNSNATVAARTPFAGNIIPAARFSSIGQTIMNLFPLPNLPGLANNYSGVEHVFTPINNVTGRLDQFIGDRQRISFRVTHVDSSSIAFFPLGANDQSTQDLVFPTRNYTASYNYTITPTLVYSLSAAYTQFRRVFYDTSQNTVGASFFGFSVNPAPPSGDISNVRPLATFDIYRGVGTGAPQDQFEGTYELTQSISKTLGKQTIRAGMDLRQYRTAGLVSAGDPNGSFGFAASQTSNGASTNGNSAAALLLGLPNTVIIQQEPILGLRNFVNAFYVTDDYKITPSLTLNLGLRYEFESPLTEEHNRSGWFNANAINSLVALPGVLEYAGLNGNPSSITSGDFNNVAPRVGFAYVPGFDNRKLVIRGAAGVYYAPIEATGFYGATPGFDSTLNPIKPNATAAATPLLGSYTLPAVAGPQGAAADLGLAITQPLNRLAKAPAIYQWNFGIQRSLVRNLVLEVMYAGNRGVHLLAQENINLAAESVVLAAIASEAAAGGKSGTAQAYLNTTVPNPLAGLVPGTLGAATITRANASTRFPQFSTITALLNDRDSVYHSLQTKLEKRLSAGVTFLFTYTFSKLIDDAGESNFNSAEMPNVGNVQNPYNLRDARAVSSYDRTHIFTGNVVYELPFGRNRRYLTSGLLNVLAGGFSLTGILSGQSGVPMAIVQGTANGLGVGSARPNVAASPAAFTRGTVNANGSVQWINPTAFTAADGQFGTAPIRESWLRGPKFWSLDLGLQRDFRITERVNLGFRAEAFNSLNHTNLDLPTQDVSSAAFGQINAVYDPRIFQFSLKLKF